MHTLGGNDGGVAAAAHEDGHHIELKADWPLHRGIFDGDTTIEEVIKYT